MHKFSRERGSINRAIIACGCVCVCAFRVCARNPEEARRRRISGLSRQTFVSDLLFFDTTRQDFRYFEIDADNELSPSSREFSCTSRYFIGATHEHFRTKLKNTGLAQLDSRHPREFLTFATIVHIHIEPFPSFPIEIHSGIYPILELLQMILRARVRSSRFRVG